MTKSQKTGLKRNTTDKFYTSKEAVNSCFKLIINYLDISSDDLCIEPSAGDGAWNDSIKANFSNYKFFDIEPPTNSLEIIEQDYLGFNLGFNDYKKIHVIGNPPFGRQSCLAIKFIKKSAEFCDSISFILPKSFKKDSLKKHFPLKFHLECEYDLSDNSFLVNGEKYDVPCVFQIWVKKEVSRVIPKKLKPKNYKFVKKTDEHDISFRRVGVYAGKIDRNTLDKSTQSHYFIKFDLELTDRLFDKLSNINYENKNNTVGARSISKQELIKEFNMIT
tara:strand:- start:358 stop:1185 length:828 start_codon:yes stop_codon:yes gene_type:complete